MTYKECLNWLTKPIETSKYLALDLFAGCGGMSLGFEVAGFDTIGFEKNKDACDTYNENLRGHCNTLNLTLQTKFPLADVLIAGPPCQPFSVNGNQLGNEDFRNGFPVCISAIEQISPKIFVLENVKGLIGKNKWYLDYVTNLFEALDYNLTVIVLNAKDFLVPQNRERLFIIGSKREKIDISKPYDFSFTSGEALEHWAYEFDETSKFLTPDMDYYIEKYERASKCIRSRDLHLQKPSRTLTCRNIGGSTGDMLRLNLPNGQRRRLNHKECARLQSFPDWFKFKGNESSVYNQIGNAVPPLMSYHIAKKVLESLEN